LELHEDYQTTLSSCSSKFDNQYKVLAIVGDNSEEFEDNNNLVLNPANITRGANHLAEGDTADSLADRVKIRLSAEDWNTIKAAIEHGVAIPADASKEVLLGYHYALRRQSRRLAKERSEIQNEGTQQLQQAQLCTQHTATHHIRIVEGTIGTGQELKT
jgi:hypothetical protein